MNYRRYFLFGIMLIFPLLFSTWSAHASGGAWGMLNSGDVYDTTGMKLGSIDPITNEVSDQSGNRIGTLDINTNRLEGVVGNAILSIDTNLNYIYDGSGNRVGSIDTNINEIYGTSINPLGSLDSTGTVSVQGGGSIGSVPPGNYLAAFMLLTHMFQN
ncbi:hypothetical protein [Saccharibacter floricola]|nr:hypothetical protein [Saccharibacter floricola]